MEAKHRVLGKPDTEAAILSALTDVDEIPISIWQMRGDENTCPDFDQVAFDNFFFDLDKKVKSKVACICEAYAHLGLNDLADDLKSLEGGNVLAATVRMQRYHAPLARVRATGKDSGVEWALAVAREVQAALDGLKAHCAADFCYDIPNGNYQIEDTILAGLIGGLCDLSQRLQLTKLADLIATVTVSSYCAPEARDRLKLVVLPNCRVSFATWCRAQGIAVPASPKSALLNCGNLIKGKPGTITFLAKESAPQCSVFPEPPLAPIVTDKATLKSALTEVLAPHTDALARATLESTPQNQRQWWQNLRAFHNRQPGHTDKAKWCAIARIVVQGVIALKNKPQREQHSDYLSSRMLSNLMRKVQSPNFDQTKTEITLANNLPRQVRREEQVTAPKK